MNHGRSEHSSRRTRTARTLAGVLAFSLLAGLLTPAFAQNSPQPDFFWPYGRVQQGGTNIVPETQTVVGLVNGKACGEAVTKVAQAGPGVPAGDVGKTVYVVDILANGTGPGQRPGCGTPGASVQLYFAGSHRMASQQTFFTAGPQRFDVELGPELGFRLTAPVLASDGMQ